MKFINRYKNYPKSIRTLLKFCLSLIVLILNNIFSYMAQLKQTTQLPFTPSWSIVPKNLELLKQRVEQVTIIAILPVLAFNLGNILITTNKLLGWLVIICGGIWWLMSVGASYYLQVSAAQGKIINTADCYRKSWHYISRIIVFTILFSLMVLVGLVLLIIPGLIIIRRYILTPFYIVDQDLPINKAMELSAKQTKPVSGYVWGILGVSIVIELTVTIISLLFVFIPGATVIIATLLSPAYYFLFAVRYTEIVKNATLLSAKA